MTRRISDINGFYEVKGNPLSKVGVFPYSGDQIGLPGFDGNKLYRVYRSEEELSNQATIDSFKLLPWINEHAMLGEDFMPAEAKGVEGTTGEEIYFEDGFLKGNIKVYSEALKSAINNGKDELSCGYRCQYLPQSGVFEGQAYDAVQVSIVGNHLASVPNGRMGPDVSVLDHGRELLQTALDSHPDATSGNWRADLSQITITGEFEMPASIKKAEDDKTKKPMTMDGLSDLLGKMGKDMEGFTTKMDEYGARMDALEKIGDPKPEDEELESSEEGGEEGGEDEGHVPGEKKGGMDAKAVQSMINAAVTTAVAGVTKKMTEASDAAVIGIGQRNEMATSVAKFTGAFDHAEMTLTGVAKYAIEKLGIPAQDGAEIPAVKAWLHGRDAPTAANSVAGDAAPADSTTAAVTSIAGWGKAKKEA